VTERATFGALGVLAMGLALSALATHAEAPVVEAVPGRLPGETPAISTELRTLRDGGKLDPNVATAAELQLLPGIGPALARRIVDDRARHGRYADVGEMARVSGIGAKRIEALRGLVAIQSSKSQTRPSTTEMRSGSVSSAAGSTTPRVSSSNASVRLSR